MVIVAVGSYVLTSIVNIKVGGHIASHFLMAGGSSRMTVLDHHTQHGHTAWESIDLGHHGHACNCQQTTAWMS